MVEASGDPQRACAAAIIKGAVTNPKQMLVLTPGTGAEGRTAPGGRLTSRTQASAFWAPVA